MSGSLTARPPVRAGSPESASAPRRNRAREGLVLRRASGFFWECGRGAVAGERGAARARGGEVALIWLKLDLEGIKADDGGNGLISGLLDR